MPIETILSIVGLAFTILSAAAAFLVRLGNIQNRIEEHEKRTDRLCEDLEGGLKSVREEGRKQEERIVACEGKSQVTAAELHRLTDAINANTRVTSELSRQMALMEGRENERERARDRRSGQ